jgi:6-phosphogluconolactonase
MINTIARSAAGTALATLALGFATAASATTVYTETNAADKNEIQIFESSPDGNLTLATQVSTGGRGTAAGLGNQSAVVMTHNHRWLFAVNAGSNDISSFAVTKGGLTWVDKVDSGGTTPVSLTFRDGLLYVLNAGGTGNIAGFAVLPDGHLAAIAGSKRPLSSSNAGAAQVGFDRDGDLLVVTEKNTNKIDLYTVHDGAAEGPVVLNSNGPEPFGFAFDRQGDLIVSEAARATVTSYDVDEPGKLTVISGSVPTHQKADCWIAIAKNFAYTTNTGSGTVSGYHILRGGELAPLSADGITAITGGGPLDAAVDQDGSTLYVLSPSISKIVTFHIKTDGSLKLVGSVLGVPATATGLAAR